MSKTDTWMPLYIGDYMADTRRLTIEQHGAYLLLLMEYWRNGPLPDDDGELALIVNVDRRRWMKDFSQTVRRFFTVHSDGTLHQKRLDAERARAEELSGKRREAANKRYAKPMQTDCNSNAIAGDLHTHAGVDQPLQSQLQKEEPPLSPPPSSQAVAKATKTKPRCQLPDDWRPSLDGFKLAQSRGLDFEETFLRFRDYHRSKGNLMASWEAAWGTWCRSPYNKPQGGKPSGLDENTRRLIELGAAQPIPDAFTGPTLDGEMFQ